MSTVKISPGNRKMGALPSVQLPAVTTCRTDCECTARCYAHKLARIRKTVRLAYQHNLDVLRTDPDTYWREVEAAVMMTRFFRFHVSGDIPDAIYLARMVEVAKRQPHCQILCFTKRYELVNAYLTENGPFPENLRVILSAWRGLPMVNPHDLPEAHVRYRDGFTTARPDAKECGGNCTECARRDGGCWSLRPGQQIVFNEH